MTKEKPELTAAEADERKNKRIMWAVVIALTVVMLGVMFWLADPPPPKSITIATGSPKGAYFAYGKRYAALLRKRGLKVKLINTAGTGQNLKLLAAMKADIAFIQTGVVTPPEIRKKFNHLRALTAIYTEPLWVFYKAGDGDKTQRNYLTSFKGQKVCIGAKGSGTEKVAIRLLRTNGVTKKNTTFLHCKLSQAERWLTKGKADAVIAISSPKSKAVRALLRNKRLPLMSFARHHTYDKQVTFVRGVKLWEGSISLRYHIPTEDKLLVAALATLAVRKDCHPQIVNAVLHAAKAIHGKGNLLDAPNTFPNSKGLEFPLHTAAVTFKHSGQGILAKTLPFWVLRLLARLKILLLPLLTLFLPAFKILPLLYKMRIKGILKKHYKALREHENAIEEAEDIQGVQDGLEALLQLRNRLKRETRSIPGAYQHELYHWRLHLDLVRRNTEERIREMRQQANPQGPSI